MKAFVNCDVFTGLEVFSDKAIIVSEGIIVDIVPMDSVASNIQLIDLKGSNIAPGFIDLQVNGGGGALLNSDITTTAVEVISSAHRKFGTTSFLPTLITASHQDMISAIDVISRLKSHEDLGVLGLHLEGPFLNPEKAGVHDKAHVRKATVEEIELLVSYANKSEAVSLMTVAPEMLDDPSFEILLQSGWKLSIGHSNAGYSLSRKAFERGVSCVTHLFNAMSPFGSREAGVVGAAFLDSDAHASVIVDGFHVDYTSVKIAKNNMGDRLFLVTDAMPPVGSNENSFNLGPYLIGRKGGKLITKDGVLGGSCLDMASAVRNCVHKVGIPLPEALRMASLYPARVIDVDTDYGLIRKGFKADMVIFNNQVQVLGTIKSGHISMY